MGRIGYKLGKDEETRQFDDWIRRQRQSQQTFPDYDGQCLLVCTELSHKARAFKVHVNRPSSQWREKRKASIMQSMPNSFYAYESSRQSEWLRKNRNQRTDKASIADREVRKTVGEDEEIIWARLKQLWRQHQARWHHWVPFWRVVDVREVSVRSAHEVTVFC